MEREIPEPKKNGSGSYAADLLTHLYEYEKNSLSIMLKKIAEEIGVTPETVRNYATGLRPIPLRHRQQVIDALRSFRWKVDPKWKLTTAVSETLGINSRHFVDVDEFILDAKKTHYKLMRLDRRGDLTTGKVMISPLGDAPRWWTYTYDTQDDITNEINTKEYSGPIVVADKVICVICSGRGGPGVERHMRIEYIWPSSTPKYKESFGISLSTFSRQGHPLAVPFVLVPMNRWNESLSKKDEQTAISETLRQMTQDGMIHLFPSREYDR
jgi:hypothetical protein